MKKTSHFRNKIDYDDVAYYCIFNQWNLMCIAWHFSNGKKDSKFNVKNDRTTVIECSHNADQLTETPSPLMIACKGDTRNKAQSKHLPHVTYSCNRLLTQWPILKLISNNAECATDSCNKLQTQNTTAIRRYRVTNVSHAWYRLVPTYWSRWQIRSIYQRHSQRPVPIQRNWNEPQSQQITLVRNLYDIERT